ncbi:MAG: PP2C family protein-serine/threonine phosphatase [Chlorobiota bacterium]
MGKLNPSDIEQILDDISANDYDTELEILSDLVNQLIKSVDRKMIGGRVWKLRPDKYAYELLYTAGDMREIPIGFLNSLSNELFFNEINSLRTNKILTNREQNKELQKFGLGNYAGMGVGELIHLESGKFFEYLIGFNADVFDDELYENLRIISRLATIAIRNLGIKKKDKHQGKELNKAGEIQRNLLPEHYTEFHDYKIFGLCLPDQEVGGDYFDYIRNESKDTEEESLGVLVCDCASKGMPAAIQALFVSGAVRMAMGFSPKITNMFGRLNNLIHKTFSRERFVTMFYGELTLSSNRLILYANAGHCPPVHYRPSRDKFQDLPPTGGFLGIMPNQKYKLENCRMLQGDTLVLYTDGISEAMNAQGELFGEQRIRDTIKEHNEKSCKEIAYMILERVQKFSANSIYNDDKTLVVIKRERPVRD